MTDLKLKEEHRKRGKKRSFYHIAVGNVINPLMPNGYFYHDILYEPISNLRGVWCSLNLSFYFFSKRSANFSSKQY